MVMLMVVVSMVVSVVVSVVAVVVAVVVVAVVVVVMAMLVGEMDASMVKSPRRWLFLSLRGLFLLLGARFSMCSPPAMPRLAADIAQKWLKRAA